MEDKMKNIDSNTLKRLLNNPHYKLNETEQQMVEVHTQELRSQDTPVTKPKARRKKRVKRTTSVNQVSQSQLRPEVQTQPDVS